MKIKNVLIVFVLILSMMLVSCDNNNKVDSNTYLSDVANEFVIPTEVKDNIEIVNSITKDDKVIELYWDISNINAIDYRGNIYRSDIDQEVDIVVTFKLDNESITKNYQVVVLKYSDTEYLEQEMTNFSIPEIIYSDYSLPQTCINENINVSWSSNNEDIINSLGVVNLPIMETKVVLTLTLSLNNSLLTKEFEVMVKELSEIEITKELNHIDTVNEFKKGIMNNLELDDEYMIMTDNEASYLSPIYKTDNFDMLVGSWSCLADQNSGSLELKYRLRINGVWSDYVSYGKWRLGDHNKDQSGSSSDKLIYIDEDTITVSKNKKADAYQYLIEFKKENDKLPVKLRLINTCVNVNVPDDVHDDLPKEVLYDVPKLYQREVPNIGGSICSPTSITMLLKYCGHDFSNMGYTYEHEYIAWLAYDYGDMVFGNWTYNVAVMGAMDEYAYVRLFSGVNDLMKVLSEIGPVALSVKGNMQGYYTTSGHLLVCKGYRITDGGIVFICNDPNIKGVEVEYTLDTIVNVWRNVAYVVVK